MNTVVCHDRYGKTYEVAAERLIFRPSAYGVIVKDGQILLSRQWDGYDWPGGGIDLGETLEEAITREIKEETGVDARIGRLLHSKTFFFTPNGQQFWHSIQLFYSAEIVSGELTTEYCAEEEKAYIALPEWIPIEKIRGLKFYNSVDNEKIVQQALELIRCKK